MSIGSHIFNGVQSMEKEVKELHLNFSTGTLVAAEAVLDLTADITLTDVVSGTARNDSTFTLEIAAAAANPTSTVLASFTGDSSAVILTITPNDGTNNTATPVTLTTAEVVELINTGAVVGKTVTVTDASSLRELQTAAGGDATEVEDSGEGDGVSATFSGGEDDITINSGLGISSVTRSAEGTFLITLDDKYPSLKHIRGIIMKSTATDLRVQIKSNAVSTGTVEILTLTGATPTDPADGDKVIVHMDLKNTAQPY